MSVKSKLLIVLLRSMVSLFNFCLEDLSSGERGVIKSPSIIVMVYLVSEIEKDLFDIHGWATVWGVDVYDCYVSLIYGSLKQYEMSFFSLLTTFGLKSTLSDMRIGTLAFLLSPWAWYVFSYSFTFSLWVSLSMKWVFCRQQIVGSFFLIQSASLCLLIDDFRPLTFRGYYWDMICIPGHLTHFCFLAWLGFSFTWVFL